MSRLLGRSFLVSRGLVVYSLIDSSGSLLLLSAVVVDFEAESRVQSAEVERGRIYIGIRIARLA